MQSVVLFPEQDEVLFLVVRTTNVAINKTFFCEAPDGPSDGLDGLAAVLRDGGHRGIAKPGLCVQKPNEAGQDDLLKGRYVREGFDLAVHVHRGLSFWVGLEILRRGLD